MSRASRIFCHQFNLTLPITRSGIQDWLACSFHLLNSAPNDTGNSCLQVRSLWQRYVQLLVRRIDRYYVVSGFAHGEQQQEVGSYRSLLHMSSSLTVAKAPYGHDDIVRRDIR